MVASITMAMPIPMPIAFMTVRSANPKAKSTEAMIAAAPVIIRPVRSKLRATARVLSHVCSVLLAYPAEQQHLVVHREAKQDAKHHDRSHCLDGTRREVEPRGQMTVLEDPDQGAIGGADGQHVHQHGLEGEQYRPKQQEEHQVGYKDDEPDHKGRSLFNGLYKIDVKRAFPGNHEFAVHRRMGLADRPDEAERLMTARGQRSFERRG